MRTCRLVGGTHSSDVMGIHRDDGAQLALNVSVEGDDIKKESGMDPLGVHIAAGPPVTLPLSQPPSPLNALPCDLRITSP